ncbi:MAG: hypothetical protein BJ554DRAFT_3555 [Olpidium bornovanus]|uniref:Uncharacterized protein n=1 Tax=Olpidium bornovanus TaxID=278681 RepID=A0A8H8A0S6_9FUNG|nr:MAG: hypothetical protein BJ554DRAFT_3555 [Olpidium bornovanus]
MEKLTQEQERGAGGWLVVKATATTTFTPVTSPPAKIRAPLPPRPTSHPGLFERCQSKRERKEKRKKMPRAETVPYNLRRPQRSGSLSGNPFSGPPVRKSKLSHDITASVAGHGGCSERPRSGGGGHKRPALAGSPLAAASTTQQQRPRQQKQKQQQQQQVARLCQHCRNPVAESEQVCPCVAHMMGEKGAGHRDPKEMEKAAAAQFNPNYHAQGTTSAAFGQVQPQKIVAGRRAGRFAP